MTFWGTIEELEQQQPELGAHYAIDTLRIAATVGPTAIFQGRWAGYEQHVVIELPQSSMDETDANNQASPKATVACVTIPAQHYAGTISEAIAALPTLADSKLITETTTLSMDEISLHRVTSLEGANGQQLQIWEMPSQVSDGPHCWVVSFHMQIAGGSPSLDQHEAHSPAQTAGKRPGLAGPPLFGDDGYASLPMYHPLFALMNAIHDAPRPDPFTGRPKHWSDFDGALVPTHITKGRRGEIRVSVRDADGTASPPMESLPKLWSKVSSLDDVSSDVLLYGLAQWASTGSNEPFWIHAPAVLDARGIQRKKPSPKQQDQGEQPAWQHGHRQEDLIDVGRAIAQLESFWLQTVNLEVIPSKGKRRNPTYINVESRAMAILDRAEQRSLDGDTIFLAARVVFGGWAKEYEAIGLRQIGAVAQQALRYDPYHQDLEKRLTKYLAFHFHWNGRSGGLITRKVGTLLEGASRDPDERHPQRTLERFHIALARLEADKVISGWGYGPVDQANPLHTPSSLPARKWLAAWLDLRIWLTPPQALIERLPRHYRGDAFPDIPLED